MALQVYRQPQIWIADKLTGIRQNRVLYEEIFTVYFDYTDDGYHSRIIII